MAVRFDGADAVTPAAQVGVGSPEAGPGEKAVMQAVAGDPDLEERIAALAGARPVEWSPVDGGGYTPAGRWIVAFENGRTAFAKVAADERTASWLRMEQVVYSGVSGSFLAEAIGWDDDGHRPILLLEDLSHAQWPPPWSPTKVARVLEALGRVANSPTPAGLPALEDLRGVLEGWVHVAEDPQPFLRGNLCSAAWLERALPELAAAEARAGLAGDKLLHLDVRSDNVCFAGDRTVLVDWNWACVGNATFDVAAWLPSLAEEGGADPQTIMPDEPELAALICGYFAHHLGQPADLASARIRAVQLSQCRAALPWVARLLELPPPDAA